jgi:hypothetical protein
MGQTRQIRVVVVALLLGFLPLLLTAYAPSAVAQGSDPTQQQPQEPAVTILVGAKKVPPPPPPAPSGAPPAPRTTPASYYEPVGPFFFYVETLTSANTTKYGIAATTPCVQSGVFKRGMRIVFRFEVLDTSTGKRVTDRDGATVKLRLPHGEEIPARWAIRGAAAALPDSAWMWDAAWDIPPDYPVGALDYSLLVTAADGRTATFIPPMQKTPTSDTRVRIVD